MGVCTVCQHAERERIEALHAAGVSFDDLAAKFGLSKPALHRHWKNHVPPERRAQYLMGAAQLEELRELVVAEDGTTLDFLRILRSVGMRAVMREAQRENTQGLSTAAVRVMDVLDRIARLKGEVLKIAPGLTLNANNVTVSIVNDPRFLELQHGLMAIGRAHPSALPDIIALMERIDAAPAPPRTIEALPATVAA